MGFSEDYAKLRKKRLEQEEAQKHSKQVVGNLSFNGAIEALQTHKGGLSQPVRNDTDIAPVVQKTNDTEERKWFQAGAFEDGYQFGDVFKTIGGSMQDVETNLMAGILGMGEAVVDAGAYLVGGVGGLFSEDFKESTKEFIAKDLYDEKEVAKAIINLRNPLNMAMPYDSEEDSVFGDKSDSLVQSGGQLLGTVALQSVGVPWFVTSGVTSFGSSAEEAFNQGATYGEAGASAAASAIIEIGTEKLFGGSGLGEKGLINLDGLTKGISNKIVKSLADFGVDMVAEGTEEFVSQIGNNLASALYKEENVLELLTSEEAFDGYLESFVGGAVLGGGANVVKTTNSIKTGRDYRTGLTANEQKVFDKEYNDRLVEAAEANNGEMPSKKEQAKIYDEVMEDLQNGSIRVDTIESIFGGEDYKAYQSILEQEKPLHEELASIENNKTLTDEQKATLKQSVEEKLQKLATDTNKAQVRQKLDDVMKGQLVRQNAKGKTFADNYLLESYNENAKRSQAYTAVREDYDDAEWEIVQKAIDSKVLNNTRRSHELVNLIAKLHKDKGVDFDFINNEKLKNSSFAVDGAQVNGYYDKATGKIGLNVESKKYLNTVVGHEITHVLEGTELYNELQTALFDYAKSKKDYEGRRKALEGLYKAEDIDSELTADLVGDYLFTDKDFVSHLSTKNRNVFQKIYDEIKYLCKVATAGSKEARQLEKVKHTFEQVYKESGIASADLSNNSKYSKSPLDKYTEKQYNDFGWARHAEAVTKNELDDMNSKIQEKRSFKSFPQSYEGEAIIEVNDKPHTTLEANNTFLFVKGTENEPEITRVVKVNFFDEASIDVFRKDIYEHSDHKSLEAYARALGEETIRYYDRSSSANYREYTNQSRTQQSGRKSKGNPRANRTWTWRDGTFEETQTNDIAPVKASSTDGVFFDGKKTKYSLSDSEGKHLTKEQSDYFKDSKVRDENGNLKVMYHGSQDAGFHVFDSFMSDDDTSLFFVDRNEVATSYSGSSETYTARTFRTAEDFNKFFAEIGQNKYEVKEEMHGDFKWFVLYEDGSEIASSETAKMLYDEFRDWTGLGEGQANYKVYLNLTNPLVVDAQGRSWNELPAVDGSKEEYRYIKMVEVGDVPGQVTIEYAMSGDNAPITETIDIETKFDGWIAQRVSDLVPGETMEFVPVNPATTRDYAQHAKKNGYDGVIFKNIIDNGGYATGREGASTVAIAFDSNQIKSVANEKPTRNADIRYSLAEQDTKLKEVGLEYDAKSETVSYSMSSLEDAFHAHTDENGVLLNENDYIKARDEYVNALARSIAADKDNPTAEEKMKASKYLDGLFLIHDMIAADKDRLDYESAVNKSAWVSNAEYGGSIDFSTLCAKRRLFTGTFDAIQNALPDTVLNENDFLKIRDMLLEKELESPCSMCYVEGSRAKHGVYVDKWLKEYLATNPEWKPQIADFTSSTRLERTRIEHPEAYAEYQKAMNKLAQRKPKEASVRTDYKGEILVAFADGSSVEVKNQNGGIRFNSFSDFEIIHALDCMQVITDMARVGLNGQAYTKVKEFAEAFGGTGLKINLSLVAKDVDANGKLIMDETNGMKYAEAMDIRNKYSDNVGTVIVVFNDAQLRAALADNTIDYVLPFHRSQWKKSQYTMMGLPVVTKDYTALQNDRIRNPKTGKPVKLSKLKQATTYTNDITGETFVIKDNIMPNMYWDYNKSGRENADRYLDYINANGMTPKFDFLLDKVDGKWVLPEGAVGDGYFKLLIDFKMYNNDGWGAPQNPVLPEFNMPYIQQMLENYKGGHQSFPVAHDVVDAFVEGKKNGAYSLSQEGEAPKRYGSYNISGDDVRLAPVQEDVAPVSGGVTETTTSETTTPTVSNLEQVADDLAPVAEVAEEITVTPVKEAYEAIKPKQTKEPSMKRIDKPVEDSAPTATFETKKTGQIDGQRTMFPEGKTAKILTEEPKVDKKSRSAWSMIKNNVLDKGMVFEDLSLATGNRELQARWNSIRYAEGKAQKLIGEGNESVSSLKSIQETVESSGKTEQFYEYLYHMHNVDRMSLEEKAAPTIGALRSKFGHLKIEQVKAIAAQKITDKTTEKTANTIREAKEYLNAIETKNKPVFGDSVTAEVSRETAAKLEKANPEFKEYAKEVYDYMNYLRGMMVDSGVISNDTAKLWADIYPHYVPIRRVGKEGLAVNVPLDTGRTGVNAPIKRATGGNSDILPLFDTMALRTEQTYKAIAKNRFGVELKNTLGTTIADEATSVDDAIDSIDAQDGLLQEGKNGNNPTFTVFEDGKRVTFEITEEMYDAMKPTGKGLSYTNKVLNTATNVFRGLLTEYNPVFMATNAVKDAQDILINSQHATKTYAAIPKAIKQMATKGHWYQEYLANGGEQNTYFDRDTNTFKAEDEGIKKVIGMPLRGISFLNNTIERVPRLAEYIASREAGRSVDVAMLDAARVTTNFAAGGDLTKALNRNGFNFLNASMQGAMQQARNVREAKANGLKGWVQLASKVALAGIPALILNNLLWDDDEEYEELSDYVKQNYYVVAKFGDGQFVRIPKGRTLAVIQNAFEQVSNGLTGDDEVDLNSFLELAINNLAPNNPLENNILAPIMQVKNNETWYGEDLVPTRLQDLPEAEQYDESTDAISKWLGEKLNYSPYKINYLLNQYTGGVGDVVLPMLTPEAESGDNSLAGNILAPWKDKFTTDSTMNNQNVSDFYDTVDELTANAKSSYATDEDVLKYKYMNSVNAELGELYKQKREIQNSNLDDAEKYEAVRTIQEKINSLARESLNTYGSVRINGEYATVGDLHYRLNDDGEWQKVSDKQLEKQEEVTEGLGIDPSEYWSNKTEYDFAYEYPEKYAVAKSVGGYDSYKTYSSELYDISADKDEDGKSIRGSRKEKVIEYVNNLDVDYGIRLILFKSEYNADDTYNEEIIEYLNNRDDISYEDMVSILKELGFTVKSDGTVTWD